MDGTISSATEQAWPAITAMVASAHARIEQARAGRRAGRQQRPPVRRQASPQVTSPGRCPRPLSLLPEPPPNTTQ